jgi:predicted RND superfamily exporter protein
MLLSDDDVISKVFQSVSVLAAVPAIQHDVQFTLVVIVIIIIVVVFYWTTSVV